MPRLKLRDIAKGLGMDVGCGDNSCLWGRPDGMGTNGGCRCHRDYTGARITATQLQLVAHHLLDVYNVQTLPTDRKRKCEACGILSRITTAGCDHCDLEDK